MQKKKKSEKQNRFVRIYNYYVYKGLISYVSGSIKKIIIPVVVIVLGLFLLERYVIDIDTAFEKFSATFSIYSIFASFLITESLLGLVPPELYIIWAGKSEMPWVFLSILAILSYLGGIVSYFIGRGISLFKKIQAYTENKIGKHINDLRKWGGTLIVVSALFPIPFSAVCMAAGIIKYDFKMLVLLGLFRLTRFYIYGIAVFNVL